VGTRFLRRNTLLRSEIINGIENVVSALVKSEVIEVLSPFFSPSDRKERDRSAILNSFRKYSLLISNFTEVEHNIIKFIDLELLSTEQFWASLLAEERAPSLSAVHEFYLKIRAAQDILPKIARLLRQNHAGSGVSPAPGAPRLGMTSTLVEEAPSLSVLLPEDDRRLSSPKRLTMTLESIEELYGALAEIDGQAPSDLVVSSCDSGSAKVFDFKGSAKIIDGLRNLILSIWDRIVFQREKQFSERLRLVKESLPILEQISEMEKSEKLGREHAERLRRQISDGVVKFMEVGAQIPEMKAHSLVSPENLLQTNETLLLAPPSESPR
jgi:hypothetical protein